MDVWRQPRVGYQPGAGAGESHRAARGRRQAPAVGELLERRDTLGLALAVRPLAEPALRDAGQLGYLALGDSASALVGERGDDRAKIASGAGVQDFGTRADALN